MTTKTISDDLRSHLQSDARSFRELAQLTGVDHARLSRFVNGKRGLSIESIDAICTVLKLQLKESDN